MKRNRSAYNIGDLPDIRIGRSKFPKMWTDLTDISQGQLVPVACIETVPGGTYHYNLGDCLRMATPVFPVMDNCYIQFDAFAVPNRIVMPDWPKVLGDNSDSRWVPSVDVEVPQLKFDGIIDKDGHYGAVIGSLSNRLYNARPIPGSELSVTDLPNRGYREIWNNFYRSEAYQDPVYVPKDNLDRSYMVDNGDGVLYGHDVLRVNRYKDYFSSVTPAPQSSDDPVMIPIGGFAPVITDVNGHLKPSESGYNPLQWRTIYGQPIDANSFGVIYPGYFDESGVRQTTNTQTDPDFVNEYNAEVIPANLVARLDGVEYNGLGGTINELRTAFQVNKLLEAYGRGGRRYRSILYNVFGVTIPDSTIQIPQFLGTVRRQINMQEVIQYSQTTESSPQGNVSAMSKSFIPVDETFFFHYDSLENGFILVLAHIRVRHTIPTAMQPWFFRKRQYDFWHPAFNALADQPVFSRYFCPLGYNEQADNFVFGYLPAWEEMRGHLNTVSGLFTPNAEGGMLAAWSYADVFDPEEQLTGYVCNDEWLLEPSSNIAQTIAVPEEPQFLLNTALKGYEILPIPVHGIGGLADHF